MLQSIADRILAYWLVSLVECTADARREEGSDKTQINTDTIVIWINTREAL
jgi:hypothetical protein